MRRASLTGLRRLLLLETEASAEPSLTGSAMSTCNNCNVIHTRELHQKKQANDVRQGNLLQVDGRPMLVQKFIRAQGVGRQLGNVQLELRDLLTKTKHPLRLRPSDWVEVVRLDEKKVQCLYLESGSVHCMHPDTFEQTAVDASLFGAGAQFLAEGQEVTLQYHDGQAVAGMVPPTVTLTVSSVAPFMKGESVTASNKPATLENGAAVMLPPFVKQGEVVVVDTETGQFLRRA